MAKWKRDVIYGIAIIIVGVVGIIETQDMKITGNPQWITRPDVYLWMWLAIVSLLAVAMIVKAIIKKDETECKPIWCREGVITIIAMGAYLALMDIIGFTVSTFFFEAGMIIFYSYKMGKITGTKKQKIRKIVVYVLIAVIATIATKLLFTEVLSTRLPKGKLF